METSTIIKTTSQTFKTTLKPSTTAHVPSTPRTPISTRIDTTTIFQQLTDFTSAFENHVTEKQTTVDVAVSLVASPTSFQHQRTRPKESTNSHPITEPATTLNISSSTVGKTRSQTPPVAASKVTQSTNVALSMITSSIGPTPEITQSTSASALLLTSSVASHAKVAQSVLSTTSRISPTMSKSTNIQTSVTGTSKIYASTPDDMKSTFIRTDGSSLLSTPHVMQSATMLSSPISSRIKTSPDAVTSAFTSTIPIMSSTASQPDVTQSMFAATSSITSSKDPTPPSVVQSTVGIKLPMTSPQTTTTTTTPNVEHSTAIATPSTSSVVTSEKTSHVPQTSAVRQPIATTDNSENVTQLLPTITSSVANQLDTSQSAILTTTAQITSSVSTSPEITQSEESTLSSNTSLLEPTSIVMRSVNSLFPSLYSITSPSDVTQSRSTSVLPITSPIKPTGEVAQSVQTTKPLIASSRSQTPETTQSIETASIMSSTLARTEATQLVDATASQITSSIAPEAELTLQSLHLETSTTKFMQSDQNLASNISTFSHDFDKNSKNSSIPIWLIIIATVSSTLSIITIGLVIYKVKRCLSKRKRNLKQKDESDSKTNASDIAQTSPRTLSATEHDESVDCSILINDDQSSPHNGFKVSEISKKEASKTAWTDRTKSSTATRNDSRVSSGRQLSAKTPLNQSKTAKIAPKTPPKAQIKTHATRNNQLVSASRNSSASKTAPPPKENNTNIKNSPTETTNANNDSKTNKLFTNKNYSRWATVVKQVQAQNSEDSNRKKLEKTFIDTKWHEVKVSLPGETEINYGKVKSRFLDFIGKRK